MNIAIAATLCDTAETLSLFLRDRYRCREPDNLCIVHQWEATPLRLVVVRPSAPLMATPAPAAAGGGGGGMAMAGSVAGGAAKMGQGCLTKLIETLKK